MKLKPTTQYHFTDADKDFMFELMKIGHVHILSSQVNLAIFKQSQSDSAFASFIDYGGGEGKSCEGLKLPNNWLIESLGFSDGKLGVTFKVKKI